MSGPSLNLQRRAPQASRAARWYRGTSELPLSKFIKIAVDLDLKHLIIWGTPSEEDLLNAWAVIYQEFLDGMQGKKSNYKVKLKSEIDKLGYDYRMIQLCVQRLSLGPSEWAVDQLRRRVRVSGEFNPEDQAGYFKQLVVVMNQALSMKHRLSERQAELNIIYSREGGGSQPTMQHFDHLVARVSLFAKFQINRQKTMTSEFIELYKEMKGHEEALRDQLETHKARR
jgi:hypothetical protein